MNFHRIELLQKRIFALAAKQNAQQLPRFTLHLDDGSTVKTGASLPEALSELVSLHNLEKRTVVSIEKPEEMDSLTEQLYEWFRVFLAGGVPVSPEREALLWEKDSPPKEPEKGPEINHNLI